MQVSAQTRASSWWGLAKTDPACAGKRWLRCGDTKGTKPFDDVIPPWVELLSSVSMLRAISLVHTYVEATLTNALFTVSPPNRTRTLSNSFPC